MPFWKIEFILGDEAEALCSDFGPRNFASFSAEYETGRYECSTIDIIRLYRDWKRTRKNIHACCGLGSVNSPYIVCY